MLQTLLLLYQPYFNRYFFVLKQLTVEFKQYLEFVEIISLDKPVKVLYTKPRRFKKHGQVK